jgi:dTDP-4-amino-4,6-dideoxygalactose transaminase
MRIRLFDTAPNYRLYREEMDAALRAVLESGQFVMGPDVRRFEREFAAYCGVRHAIGVLSGTDALHFLIRAHGIRAGDEVITAVNSDVATGLSIEHAGAQPVWVDIDSETFNIDPALVEAAVTPRTRAIVAIHMYGLPAPMDALRVLAARHRLLVLEDAALAAGATYREKKAGALADGGAFSVTQGKVLSGLGTGGVVTTDDDAVAAALNSLRNYGRVESPYREDYEPGHRIGMTARLGFNSRLDTLQAAALRVRLRHLDAELAHRRRMAEVYNERLAAADVTTPKVPEGSQHAYRAYVVRTPRRDRVQAALLARQIETGVHYTPPTHLHPHYGGTRGEFPVAERVSDELLCLPCHPALTEEDVHEICDIVVASDAEQ